MRFCRLILALIFPLWAVIGHTQTTHYRIDPKHTAATMQWQQIGLSNPSARFSGVQGRICVDHSQFENSSVDVNIPVKNMQTDLGFINQTLQSKAWLNSAQYPQMNFKSTQVRRLDQNQYSILGTLTIKGISKPVELTAKLKQFASDQQQKRVGFIASTKIKRSDFKLTAYAPTVSDIIYIQIQTEAFVP